VVAWAILILVATTVPATDLTERLSVMGVDKLVHGGLYFVLGWLVAAALCAMDHRAIAGFVTGLLGLASFAALDEAHQLWIPGRVTSVGDWTADLVGATLGLAAGMLVWRALEDGGEPGHSRQEEIH
jgi:VanZ family protein